MNHIYVISKTMLSNSIKNICPADKNLHKIIGNASKTYIGCVYSKNLYTSQRILINISAWSSVQMWENWKNSSDRHYLKMDYKNNYNEEFKIIK